MVVFARGESARGVGGDVRVSRGVESASQSRLVCVGDKTY